MTYIRPAEGRVSNTYAQHVARNSVNPGEDVAIARGTPIRAPQDGRVARVRTTLAGSGAAGRFIIIYHSDGNSSDLLHLSRVDVKVGDWVAQGETVGLSGGSANGSETGVGAHIHWTLRTRQVTNLSNAGNFDPATALGPANPWSNHRNVQTRLNVWLKHWGLTPLVVDGVFGPKSRAALTEFQKRLGLIVDGKLGPQSWTAMSKTPTVVVPTPPPAPAPIPVPEPEEEEEPVAPAPVEPSPASPPELIEPPKPPREPKPQPTPHIPREKEHTMPTVPVPETPDVILPARVRAALYLGNWGVGVALAATAAGVLAVDAPVHPALVAAIAVYGVLSSAISGLARANTKTVKK